MSTSKDKRYYDTHRDEILKKKAEYRERKREEIRQRDRERYAQNPDKYKKKSKKYRDEHPEEIVKYKEENRDHILERNKKYNEEHREEKQDWYYRNREKVLNNQKVYRKNNPDIIRKGRKAYVLKVRDDLFNVLGIYSCVDCGLDDKRCLQFDHINGRGLDDIKKHGNSRQLYRYYIKHPEEARITLTVRCANHNWIKKFENNENSYQTLVPPIT